MIRRMWAAVAEPSMMRRSMLAQMAVLCLLWLLLVVFLVYDASKDVTTLRQNALYEAMFSAAENLEGQPEKMHATMAAMERAMRTATGTEADPALGPTLVVERAGQALYRSQGAPAGVAAESLDRIETRNVDGRRWRTRALESPRSGVRVTMIVPADGMNIFLTLGSRGTLLLPLLVSLPFLILPAWGGGTGRTGAVEPRHGGTGHARAEQPDAAGAARPPARAERHAEDHQCFAAARERKRGA
ncbi:hypothetical protein ACHMW6_18895 [Pseudoduganella sp. UC29_106]|uniref:hypothetical protein n=1 Tax=Pseudoduganella sp. UC29_106 TaxID=3374553 RepID=UPI0037584050